MNHSRIIVLFFLLGMCVFIYICFGYFQLVYIHEYSSSWEQPYRSFFNQAYIPSSDQSHIWSSEQPHVLSSRQSHINSSKPSKQTPVQSSLNPSQKQENNSTKSAYLVDTSACKIPNIGPFDKSIKHMLRNGSELRCPVKYDLVYQVGTSLNLNWTAIRASGLDIKFCDYDVIYRSYDEAKDHNYFEVRATGINLTSITNISDEFVRVRYFNKTGGVSYTNVFAFVFKKDRVEKKCIKKLIKNAKNRKESVMMIGLDSISRNNMLRYMKKTWTYLVNSMSAFDFFGYNKVADNTFVNIVPMTAGKYVEELPWNETLQGIPMDKYNFIWYNYSENGYRTLYAEDHPDIAIFDYLKAGFEKPPCDYFNRPLSVAAKETVDIWTLHHHCMHGRTETKLILDYVKQFANLFRSDPYFSFSFTTKLTHDSLEEAYKADKLNFHFLKEMHEKGNFNNTILFFFSDHGMRFGDVRETFVGKLEERLPFMLIVPPPWFLNKYPQIRKNLQINTQRLVTPFDIFATLEHILYFDGKTTGKVKKKRTLSLFNEIPEDRSCEDADILPHWCTCSSHENLDVKNETAINVGKTMVGKINDQLKTVFEVCERLNVKAIRYAIRIIPSDKVLRFEESKNDVLDRHVVYGKRAKSYIDYQVTLQTSPGDAVFEGTIRFDEENKSFDLVGDVSRINKYGQQSYCIDVHHLKKFCFCKILTS